ncbi:hypothetical protein TNCV_2760641 [Trichonephila clavipes]|nr:hypothetical protein TNCV_2760641 [Trichonephila clavipes]
MYAKCGGYLGEVFEKRKGGESSGSDKGRTEAVYDEWIPSKDVFQERVVQRFVQVFRADIFEHHRNIFRVFEVEGRKRVPCLRWILGPL